MPWYYAFLFALVIGYVISYCYYCIIKKSPLSDKSVLYNYVFCDVCIFISKLATVYLPVFILMTEVQAAEGILQKYPANTWVRSTEALLRLRRQSENMVGYKKLEIVSGAINRERVATGGQNSFGQVFYEFFSDQTRISKIWYKEALKRAEELDQVNAANTTLRLNGRQAHELTHWDGFCPNDNVNEVRKIWARYPFPRSSPVSPTLGVPTTVAPTPVVPTPVAPTPVAPTPASPGWLDCCWPF